MPGDRSNIPAALAGLRTSTTPWCSSIAAKTVSLRRYDEHPPVPPQGRRQPSKQLTTTYRQSSNWHLKHIGLASRPSQMFFLLPEPRIYHPYCTLTFGVRYCHMNLFKMLTHTQTLLPTPTLTLSYNIHVKST